MPTQYNIAIRFREVIFDGKWIANTNYRELLKGITWDQAIHKTGNLNTIAALTFHVHYYIRGILTLMQGGKLDIHDRFSFNLPDITCEKDWIALVDTFFSDSEQFLMFLENMDDEAFEMPFGDGKYGNWRRNTEGVIAHLYYHLGQISLLRKLHS